MKKIKYTPDAADKLRAINRSILLRYGSQKAKTIIGKITGVIRGLTDNEEISPLVEDCIRIINIYHEREDFMWLLFGIATTPQETIDYWGED